MGAEKVSQPVRMKVCWRVTPHESSRITSALHALMVVIRAEPSCLGCQLSTEMGEQTGICYTEEWKDEVALQRQLRSLSFSQLAELMERSTERPRVEFVLPSGVRGLEYAEEVRGK